VLFPSSAAEALPPNKIPPRRPFVVLVLVLPELFWRERRLGMWMVGIGKEVVRRLKVRARRGVRSVVFIVEDRWGLYV
jgi:hypothetical protein